jgi:hypothetical protein
MKMSKVKNIKMHPTQARFDNDSWAKLNKLSKILGCSKMEIIREAFEVFSSVLGNEIDMRKSNEMLKAYQTRVNILKNKNKLF